MTAMQTITRTSGLQHPVMPSETICIACQNRDDAISIAIPH